MPAKAEKITGKVLNEKYGVGAKHALYHEEGKWYHKLSTLELKLFENCKRGKTA